MKCTGHKHVVEHKHVGVVSIIYTNSTVRLLLKTHNHFVADITEIRETTIYYYFPIVSKTCTVALMWLLGDKNIIIIYENVVYCMSPKEDFFIAK